MSNFNINLRTGLNDSQAMKDMASLQKKLNEKKVKLNVELGDVSKLNSEISKIKNIFNNAFKMDKTSLSNLKHIESTLKQINKLGKDAQKSIFGKRLSDDTKSKELDSQLKKYKQLTAQKDALEKQMSKTTNKQSYSVLNSQLEKVKSNIRSLGKELNNNSMSDGVQRSLAQTFQKAQAEIAKAKSELSNFSKTNILDSKQISQISKYQSELSKLSNMKLKNMNFMDVQKLESDINRIKNQFSNFKIPDINTKLAQQFKSMQSNVDSLIAKTKQLGKSGYSDKGQVNRMLSDLQRLKSLDLKSMDNLTMQKSISELNKLEQESKEVESAIKNLKFQDKLQVDTSKVQSDLQKLRQACMDAGKSTSDIDRLERELRELSSMPMDKVPASLSRIKSEVNGMKSSFSGLNNVTRQTNGFFNNLYMSMSTFTLGNMIGYQLQNGIRSIGKTIIELDSSFRDMMKVAPDTFKGTASDLDMVKNKAISAGQEVARSSNDIIQGTAKAFQQGIKSIDDAMEFAKKSAMFANVADMSQEDSNSTITSIMAAYTKGGVKNSLKPLQGELKKTGEEYNNLTKFSDLANYAGNNFSVTTKDVGESLKRSASVLSSFGVSMQDSVALSVGMNETVQNAEKTGMALKSVGVNLTGVKASLKDGTISTNKTAKTLKQIADIDVWNKQTGDIKSQMQVLQELSTKWKGFNDDQRAAISESIAGKHHINSFMALMNNWETVLKYQQDYKNGLMEGSADKENARFVDSIEGRIVTMKEELKKLVTTTISSDMFKDVVTGATNFLKVLNSIVSTFDKFGMSTPLAIGAVSSLFSTVKAKGTGKDIPNHFRNIKNSATSAVSGFKNVQKATTLANGATIKYTTGIKNLNNSQRTVAPALAKTNSQYKQMRVATTSAGTSANKLSSSLKKSSSGIMFAGAKSMLANTAVTLLNGAMITLAVAGIGAAVKALDNYKNRLEIAREESLKKIDDLNTEISAYKGQENALRGIQKEYDTLKNKQDKTKEESQRFLELNRELAEIMPELVTGYDENNNPIISMRGDVADLISDLNDAIDRKNALMATEKREEANIAADLMNKSENTGIAKPGKGDIYVDSTKEKLGFIDETYNKKLKDNLKERQNILKAIGLAETIEKRRKEEKKLRKNFDDEIRIYDEYKTKYQSKQNELRQLSETMKNGVFSSIETSSAYSSFKDKTKKDLSDLKSSMDFSDFKRDDLPIVTSYIQGLGEAANNGEYDLVKLRKSVEDANTSLTNGEITTKQYEKTIRDLAKGLAEVVPGSDENTWYNLLDKMGDGAVKASADLDTFLNSFGKTKKDLQNNDSLAIALRDQFNAVGKMTDEIINLQPNVGVEPIMKIANAKNIPKQIGDMVASLGKDGDINGSEKNVIITAAMAFQMGDTSESRKMLEQVNRELEALGVDPIDIKAFFDAKDAENKMKEFEASLKQFEDEEIITKIKMDTNLESKSELDSLAKQLNQFEDKDTKLKFIADCGDAFQGVNSLDEALKKIPDSKKLEYNIGVKGNNELEQAKAAIDEMPEDIKTLFYTETIGLDKIKIIQGLIDKYGGKEAKAKLGIEGATQALSECKTLDEFLNWLNGKEATTNVNQQGAEETKQEVEDIYTEVEEGAEGEVKVEADTDAAKKDLENFKDSFKGNGNGTASLKFVVDSGSAITNINNLKKALDGASNTFNGVKGNIKFSAETAAASKNVTGLKRNVSSYVKSYCGKSFSTKFNTQTAQASQNVTGLKRNVSNYVSSYAGKTFTTTFKTVTVKETKTIATSGGKKPGTGDVPKSIGTPRAIPVAPQTLALHRANPISSQPQISPMTLSQAEATESTGFSATPRASVFSSNMLSRATQKTPLAIKGGDIANALKYDLDLLTELNNRIKIVTNSLSALDTKMEHAVGNEKIKYLKDQIKLYEEQKRLLKEQEDALIRHRNLYKSTLQNKGFKFNSDNNMTNYEEKILALEKEYERLEKISSKDKATDKQKNATESAKKALDEAKKYAEAYFKMQMEEIPKCKEEWDKLNNTIKDHNKEIKKIEGEKWALNIESQFISMNRHVTEINNQLAMLDILMEGAFGLEKNNLLQQKIDLLEQQKKELGDVNKHLNDTKKKLMDKAKGFGFQFREDGTIINYTQRLNELKATSEDFEEAKKIVDGYLDVWMDKIPDVEKELAKLNNAIRDACKEKLEVTSKIEDKITQMYKKQLEDRKKVIQDELDAKLKALNKEQKAYNDARKEADYQNDYDKQLEKVMELEKKIEIAKRDSSESGKKKLKDLMKELKEQQEALEKLVQDKTDSDINDMFDDEKERLEEDADKLIKDLEEKFSDSKIAELVSQAISSGIFTGIDGEVSDLKDAMVDFLKETGELWGVQGKLIEQEYIGNLQIALQTMKDIKDIYEKLDVNKYNPQLNTNTQKQASRSMSPELNFNSPLMVVEGDITKDVLPEVKNMLKQFEAEFARSITKMYKY